MQRKETAAEHEIRLNTNTYLARANRCYPVVDKRTHAHETCNENWRLERRRRWPYIIFVRMHLYSRNRRCWANECVHEKTWANNVALEHYACQLSREHMQIARAHAYIVICGRRSRKYRLISFCIRFTRQPYKCLCILIAPHTFIYLCFSLSRILRADTEHALVNWLWFQLAFSVVMGRCLLYIFASLASTFRWRFSLKNSQACLMSHMPRHASNEAAARKKQQHWPHNGKVKSRNCGIYD